MLRIGQNTKELSDELAEQIVAAATTAITDHGRFLIAVSGGSLPAIAFDSLVTGQWKSRAQFDRWHIFFADERCVKLSHPDSNYQQLQKHLLQYVNIPEEQIYTLNETLDPPQAAEDYEQQINKVFALSPSPSSLPSFDLILLGFGDDGHTASLFPNHPLLEERERKVAFILDSPKPPPQRITLTFPVINNARNVWVVGTGAGKAAVVKQVFDSDSSSSSSTKKLPIQMSTGRSNAKWFVDEMAVKDLPTSCRYV